VIFGGVTLACLLTAMTLSVYGHHPVLMVPIAVACAIVFIRHGDGREHSRVPSPAEERQLAATRRRGSIPTD
jgi:hypothetical protein